MERYTRYWVASLVRGIMALIAGLAVLVFPQMVSLVFLLPFAILISMICLAAYGIVDSVLLLVASFLLSHDQSGRYALRVQGILGAISGTVLFFFRLRSCAVGVVRLSGRVAGSWGSHHRIHRSQGDLKASWVQMVLCVCLHRGLLGDRAAAR